MNNFQVISYKTYSCDLSPFWSTDDLKIEQEVWEIYSFRNGSQTPCSSQTKLKLNTSSFATFKRQFGTISRRPLVSTLQVMFRLPSAFIEMVLCCTVCITIQWQRIDSLYVFMELVNFWRLVACSLTTKHSRNEEGGHKALYWQISSAFYKEPAWLSIVRFLIRNGCYVLVAMKLQNATLISAASRFYLLLRTAIVYLQCIGNSCVSFLKL